MVRFENISVTEKTYPYKKAVAETEVINGAFGAITAGKFKPAAKAFEVVMNLEDGDDAFTANFKLPKGKDLRVADLTKVDGVSLSITSEHLPATVAVGNKLESKADGTLVVNASATGKYLEITEVTSFGVNANVVVGA